MYQEAEHYIKLDEMLVMDELEQLRKLCATQELTRIQAVQVQRDYLYDMNNRIRHSRGAMRNRPPLENYLEFRFEYADAGMKDVFAIMAMRYWLRSIFMNHGDLPLRQHVNQLSHFYAKRNINISLLRKGDPHQWRTLNHLVFELMEALNITLDKFEVGKPAMTKEARQEQKRRIAMLKKTKLEDIATLQEVVLSLAELLIIHTDVPAAEIKAVLKKLETKHSS